MQTSQLHGQKRVLASALVEGLVVVVQVVPNQRQERWYDYISSIGMLRSNIYVVLYLGRRVYCRYNRLSCRWYHRGMNVYYLYLTYTF